MIRTLRVLRALKTVSIVPGIRRYIIKNQRIIKIKNAKIQSSRQLAHYDGEPMDVLSELNVSVVPKSLNIVVGKSRK